MSENPYHLYTVGPSAQHDIWNEGYNQAIKTMRVELSKLSIWDDDILWLKVDKRLEALKKASE